MEFAAARCSELVPEAFARGGRPPHALMLARAAGLGVEG
jgi:hypothetical protein